VRELGDTLNEMLERIEATMRRERRFIADASHEIRAPLSLLRTELELARWPDRTREQLEQALQSAGDETDRLTQLAEDLLVLARSDDGKLPVRHEQLSAHDLLADAALRFQARAEALGRAIVVDGSDVALIGDRLRLEQALGNLIDNALRHGTGTVRLFAAGRDGEIELHVCDDGTGFAAGFLSHAFERFTRADEARSRGGTGLGLAIVDVIAQAHGGRARAGNRVPHGADVWIALPSSAAATVVT
jgi:signal transduction histidine kinase